MATLSHTYSTLLPILKKLGLRKVMYAKNIHGDPGAVNRGATKINRGGERFHESLQGRVQKPLRTDSYQTISKRLGECWLLIGQKNPLYYSA